MSNDLTRATNLACGLPPTCAFQTDLSASPADQADTTQSSRSLSGGNRGLICHPRNSLLPRLCLKPVPPPRLSAHLAFRLLDGSRLLLPLLSWTSSRAGEGCSNMCMMLTHGVVEKYPDFVTELGRACLRHSFPLPGLSDPLQSWAF